MLHLGVEVMCRTVFVFKVHLAMNQICSASLSLILDFIIKLQDFLPSKIWVRPSDIATLIIVAARVWVEPEKI